MSEMVERVAKAIIAASGLRDLSEEVPTLSGIPLWQLYTGVARAAIEAMREPLLAIIAKEEQGFLSPEYATNQPLSSLQERFACREVAKAIAAALSPSREDEK